MNLSAITIRTRIIVAIGLLSAGMVAVGILGLFGMHQELERLQGMYNQRVMLVSNLGDLRAAEFNGASLLGMIVMSESRGHTGGLEHIKGKAKTHHAEAVELIDEFVTRQDSEAGRSIAQTVKRAHDSVRATIDKVYAALAANQHDLASKIIVDDLAAKIADLDDAMDMAAAHEHEAGQVALAAGEQNFARDRTVVVVGIIVVLLLGVVVSVLLVREITSGLNSAVTVADEIAGGRLGRAIDTSRLDEVGMLLKSLLGMDTKLHQIVGSVRETTGAVSRTARELSQGNDDLSQRTQEQASALAGTASSMEMMTATVKQNADNAREANQLASSARGQAERGGAVVSKAVAAMGDINTVSRKIADIIGVIDEIAFQTNLLALNAAVEAARAGEQGKGFAVVATEVRSLAQRSATAAREIKELIGDSVGKVRTGSALVDESGKVLNEIMDSIKRVSDIVAEIAAASEEQATGIEEVKDAVTKMDRVTQQNAALVEEAAAAAKLMEQQAEVLVQEIAYFASNQDDMPQAAMPLRLARKPSAPSVRSARPRTSAKAAAATQPPMARASGDDTVWQEF